MDEAVETRGVVNSRTLSFPRAAVFAKFRDPEALGRWWGPKDFTSVFHEFEFKPGGSWRFTLRGPNGAEFQNVSTFYEIVEPERVTIHHLSAPRYELVVTLHEDGPNTRLEWRHTFESEDMWRRVKDFVPAANEENLDRLTAELAR